MIYKGNERSVDFSTDASFRNNLLSKCKQTIEELHIELEAERKSKGDLEHRVNRLESEYVEREKLMREHSEKNLGLNGK